MKYCLNCNKEFEGRKNKIYCSDKCRERKRFLRRCNLSHYKIMQRKRDIKYYHNGGKEVKLKYHKTKKFKDYQNKWRRDRKYWREQYEKHPENIREKMRKYRKTLKGKQNTLICNQKRRKKIFFLTGKSIEKLDANFLITIRERDKVCVYCGKKFNNTIKTDTETFDHLNCDKPLSLDNALRCCWSCNSSKTNTSIEEVYNWIKRKKFTPSPIVMELINKKKKNKVQV